MKHLLVAIRDAKAEFFSPPVIVRTRGEAIRSFSDAVNDPQHQFHGHAEDFALFELGTVDVLTGEVAGGVSPLLIINGFEVKQAPEVKALKVAK